MRILALLLASFLLGSLFACMATRNSASAVTSSCENIPVGADTITNPNLANTAAVTYSGTTATVVCSLQTTGTGISTTVGYTTSTGAATTTVTTLTLECVSGSWLYTAADGTESTVTNVYCNTVYSP